MTNTVRYTAMSPEPLHGYLAQVTNAERYDQQREAFVGDRYASNIDQPRLG
jgi:hypothetical protein